MGVVEIVEVVGAIRIVGVVGAAIAPIILMPSDVRPCPLSARANYPFYF